jgi:hypothetical protein
MFKVNDSVWINNWGTVQRGKIIGIADEEFALRCGSRLVTICLGHVFRSKAGALLNSIERFASTEKDARKRAADYLIEAEAAKEKAIKAMHEARGLLAGELQEIE